MAYLFMGEIRRSAHHLAFKIEAKHLSCCTSCAFDASVSALMYMIPATVPNANGIQYNSCRRPLISLYPLRSFARSSMMSCAVVGNVDPTEVSGFRPGSGERVNMSIERAAERVAAVVRQRRRSKRSAAMERSRAGPGCCA